MSYYARKRFTDPRSGDTDITFWEAAHKEKYGSLDAIADFPEALREPVLRRCQFSQIARLEELVGKLYHEFKHNILPGEQVLIEDAETGDRSTGIVRDRAMFFERPDINRYFVQLITEPRMSSKVACVDQAHIRRRLRTFTKFNIQRFLRHTIERDRYEGAPWVVKHKYAHMYRIDTQIPHHLTYEAISAQRRLQNGLRKGRLEELPSSFMVKDHHVIPRPGARPTQQDVQYVHERFEGMTHNGEHVLQMRPAPSLQSNGHFQPIQPQPPLPPPIRYPIEDLMVEPKKGAKQRPRLHNFTKHPLFPTEEGFDEKEGLSMESIGPLLETWNTLTVFAEYFELDAFVFDDFVGALYVASESVPCTLFEEVFCGVLKRLVDTDGKILSPTIAKAGTEDSSDSSSEDTESDASNEDKAEGTSPQSSHSADVEMKDASTNGQELSNRAQDMLRKQDWVDLLRQRRFDDGGWTLIMVGLLDQLSYHRYFKTRCESILRHLAPSDKPATADTAYKQFMSMDVNLRVQALEIPTILVIETKSFKDHIEHLVTESTETRKQRTNCQSQRKNLVSEMVRLDQQAKLLRPAFEAQSNAPKSKSDDTKNAQTNGNTEDEAVEDSDEVNLISDDDDEQVGSSRRISNNAAHLKRKRELEEEEKQIKGASKEAVEYRKVLKELSAKTAEVRDIEEQIDDLEIELRENACHRTKILGRDRFLNRYIWFERNGMPFEGQSESANYEYSNGRLWVQGPDDLEKAGLVDLDEEDEKEYESKFKMTVSDRRDREEGDTQLLNAREWGYYDDPEEITLLIDWLEVKGEREKSLKKELQLWRKDIQKHMKVLKEHLDEVAEEISKLEDRPVGIATRKKQTQDLNAVRYPCLRWYNSVADERYGQPLSAGPPPKRTNKKSRAERATREVSAQPERRATRQGTKFAR